jgi:tetratricopeptide (TPR) repeat protein
MGNCDELAEADPAKGAPARPLRASVRSLPGGYLAAAFVVSFISAFLGYIGFLDYSLVLAFAAWTIMPLLWITDRVVFDGKRIRRTGLVPRLIARATGLRDRLKISDIEQIETRSFPGIKRGRNIYFTYRTTVTGKSARFVFSSGHRGFRSVIKALLPLVPEEILDNASIEVRDYLAEKNVVRERARESEIPSSDVLDASFRDIHLNVPTEHTAGSGEDAYEKANALRRLANELRLSGLLLQALEAFRRAAMLRPRDARLLFEFAECIRSVAGSESDHALERRGLAMMRLAERYARDDRDLLTRIGESYFQIGEWRRAGIVFRRVADTLGEDFRALRGMAELALREGKIAHVIHNFSAAERLAQSSSLKRWTKAEVEYFSHLNSDDEYMELEISRVNLLDTLERTKRSAIRIAMFGIGVIVFGISTGEDLIANIGWTVSGLSVTVWTAMIFMVKLLSARIPFELMETEE